MNFSEDDSEHEDNAVNVLVDMHYAAIPKPRVYAPRSEPFQELDDENFVLRFRLSKRTVMEVLHLIEEHLTYPSERNTPVSPLNQLLLTLRFYATGSFLVVCGDMMGVHKSSASRILHKVTHYLALLGRDLVKMPTTVEEKRQAQLGFYSIAGYPGVIGALDCTHVPIQSPGGDNGELYRNRKQFFSINVQAICKANLVFTNVVARWPGFTHDSTIFNNSEVHAQFEIGEIVGGILLADSAYACRSYVHTPLLLPATEAERNFNSAHKSTRNVIERAFGVLKRRFPCLSMKLRVKLCNVPPIIVATVVLHNIAIAANEVDAPLDPAVALDPEAFAAIPVPPHDQPNRAGATANRTALINTVFHR